MSDNFVAVARLDELSENSSKVVIVKDEKLLICKADGAIFCVQAICTHRAESLEGGRIRRCMVICPVHGVPFDLKTGKPHNVQLTETPLRVYDVRVVDGRIEVNV